MQNTDRTEFTRLMEAACAAFNTPPNEPLFEAYWIALHDKTLADVKRAITTAFVECKFMPRPAELLEFVDGNPAQGANTAFDKLVLLCRDKTAVHPCKYAQEVIRRKGGMKYYSGLDNTQLEFERKLFIASYKELVGEVKRGELVLRDAITEAPQPDRVTTAESKREPLPSWVPPEDPNDPYIPREQLVGLIRGLRKHLEMS